jgi:hypothetical protein
LMSNSIIIWLHFLFNKGSPIKCNNEKKPTAAVIFSMSQIELTKFSKINFFQKKKLCEKADNSMNWGDQSSVQFELYMGTSLTLNFHTADR